MKSWLAQGSSGRRVTLLPGTTFFHINGALLGLFRVWFRGLHLRAVMHDVGETTRHFFTHVREHLVTQNSENCRPLCSVDCFHSFQVFGNAFESGGL